MSIVGTPVYMAPEILKKNNNEDGYTNKCDIYSFGIMLIEMITLESPYKECKNVLEIMTLKEKIKLPESIFKINDKNVFKFICGCLIPIPE